MKKLLFVLAAVATLFASCNPEAEVKTPSVSFQTAEPAVDGDEATFTVVVSNYTGTDPLTIPVLVETEAVEGTDYEISATEFVWGGENPVTAITVKGLVFNPEMSIKLALQLPEGTIGGKYMSSELKYTEVWANVSFEEALILTEAETLAVKVQVSDETGEYEVSRDTEFMISVNEEKSTAVLGTHFEFDYEENFACVYEGMSDGEVYINILEVEEGKDKIVLRLDEPEGYGFGNYFEVEIRLVSYWEKFAGKWEINEIISTIEYIDSQMDWCGFYDWDRTAFFAGFPAFNAEDTFEIVINDATTGVLKPSFKSALKDYFIGETNMTKGDTHEVYLDGTSTYPPIAQTRIAICDNINRYFSATEVSADKEGYVALGLSYDDELGAELLEMYIIDHTSHSFMKNILELSIEEHWVGYSDEKPVADMPGMWIGATFKRVTE